MCMSINSITSKFDSSSNVQFGIGNNNSSTIASVLTENEQNLQAGHSPSRAAQRQALSQRLANTIERNRLRQSTPAVSGNANVATNKADGTGLGLASASRIAQAVFTTDGHGWTRMTEI